MAADSITFDDGATHEDFIGKWSLLAGHAFLDWLAPAPGLRRVDVGCGNGAFTELLEEPVNQSCGPNSKVKQAPPSSPSVMATVAPCSTATSCTMARPRPVPSQRGREPRA